MDHHLVEGNRSRHSTLAMVTSTVVRSPGGVLTPLFFRRGEEVTVVSETPKVAGPVMVMTRLGTFPAE